MFCKTSYIKPMETKIQLYALTKRVKQNKYLRKFVRIELDLNINDIESKNIFIIDSYRSLTSGLPSSGN